MKHEGLHYYRTKRNAGNPLEAAMAHEWESLNSGVGRSTSSNQLAYLLGDGRDPAQPSERDAQVAATVLQWLGSPVGFRWLLDGPIGREIAKQSKRDAR